MADSTRDHLFISYATEDGAFAEWLALRLTGEGYKVWCDRIKLLGGESYPLDIDSAVKNETFRFLALLSRHSITKPNPVKERTLALSLAAQRDERFVVPLNLDGLRATDLDWMTSDITFIPFHRGWAAGLAQLLAALEKARAPKTLAEGRSIVADYVAGQDVRRDAPERLWTTVFRLTLPDFLLRVTGDHETLSHTFEKWPHYCESKNIFWAFELPPGARHLRSEPYDWRGPAPRSRLSLSNAVVNLMQQYFEAHCASKGLSVFEDEHRRRHLFLQPNTVPGNWLMFTGYDGARSRVKATGERTFRTAAGRDRVRYHLSPTYTVLLNVFAHSAVVVRIRVHLTDLDGRPLATRSAQRRRKSICKSWWNHEWLARLLGLTQWLTGGQPLNLALTDSCRIVLDTAPLQGTVSVGVPEGAPPVLGGDDADIVEDDDAEDGADD